MRLVRAKCKVNNGSGVRGRSEKWLRNRSRQWRRGEVLVRLGEPCTSLLFKSCSLLWRPLAFLAPLPWFSSVTEGLMTATQSGATALQLQFLQERWWEGDEMTSVCCQHLLPLQGDGKRGVPRAACCENTKNSS